MKQAKYKNSNFEAHKKVRKTWPISPITKIVPHKTDNIGSNKMIRQAIEELNSDREVDDFSWDTEPENPFYNDLDATDFG